MTIVVVKCPGSGICWLSQTGVEGLLEGGCRRGYFVGRYAPIMGYTLPGTLASLAQEKRRPQLCSRVRRLRSPHRNDVQAEPAGVSIYRYTPAPRVVILVTLPCMV